MIDREDRDAGLPQRRELGLDRVVAEDRDDRVDLVGQEDVVVVGVDLVVAPAIDGHDLAAQALDRLGGAVERLAVPEVLRADDGHADALAVERQIVLRGRRSRPS